MAAELWEIRDFLSRIPVFAALPNEALDRLPERMTVRYCRRGSTFPPSPSDGLWILRSGALELRSKDDGTLIDKLAEGDFYKHEASLAPSCQLTEDSLFYRLPLEAFTRLGKQYPEFALHFERSNRERLQQALRHLQSRDGLTSALMGTTVSSLIRRTPVTSRPDISIQEAASIMSEQGISALLIVEHDQLLGLVTDRDLRRRCLAAGRSPQEPVSTIMTTDLETVTPNTLAFEASLIFSRRNIHHLPVMEGRRLCGIISTSDLLRHQSTNTVHLVRDAHAATTREELIRIGRRLSQLQCQLVAMGADGTALGESIVTVTDALTQRLLELGQQKLGPAPIAWAWAALGSQGRREQTAHTDQDHALILGDDYDEANHGEWFKELAYFVSSALDEAGIRYCPGGVMASNPQWRQPVSIWKRYFHNWITNPDPKALMLACNFFDMRVVAGDPQLLEQVWETARPLAKQNSIFQRFLAANALITRPPLGFFRQLVIVDEQTQTHRLDLKLSGLLVIADLARLHALTGGLTELHTLDRLEGAAQNGLISQDAALALRDAWRLLYTLRARHQDKQIRQGIPPDNCLNPARLSSLERGHLRDAFRVILDHQKWVRQHFAVGSIL